MDTVQASYDQTKPTMAYTDHGPEGLGSTLTQGHVMPGQREQQYRPINYYSRSLTKSEKSYGKIDQSFACHRYPDQVVHDGGPPYNSHNFKEYAKKCCFETDLCNPEHPQANGQTEKFMISIIKLTHASITKGKDLKKEIYTFLMNYRNTPHSSIIAAPTTAAQKEAQQKDAVTKAKQKKCQQTVLSCTRRSPPPSPHMTWTYSLSQPHRTPRSQPLGGGGWSVTTGHPQCGHVEEPEGDPPPPLYCHTQQSRRGRSSR